MKFVVIDDSPDELVLLRSAFQRRGHEVVTYDNPWECPIFTSAYCPCKPVAICPDVIISDIDMPKVTGVEFVERVINKRCHCKHVAFLSGRELPDEAKPFLTTAGVRFFEKPLDFDAFDAWLAR
jgi:CheY-like chemotaxis protein